MANRASLASEWQHLIHADLIWALRSPALVRPELWNAEGVQLATCDDWTLPEGFPRQEDAPQFIPQRRLGHHFEQVHRLLLENQPHLKALAFNRRISHGPRTLGEIDSLYATTTHVVHRELAVKFYLGREDCGDTCNWIGPNKIDRLDLKVHRLLAHQTKLAGVAKKLDIWPADLPYPTKVEVLLRGAFFKHPRHRCWPDVMHQTAETGFWCTSQEFAEQEEGPWAQLRKPWWLSSVHAAYEPLLSVPQVVRLVETRQAPCLVGCPPPGRARLGSRGFVVPNAWPLSGLATNTSTGGKSPT